MDISKRGNSEVTMPGNLNVKAVKAKAINVAEDAVIEGDLIVKGKVLNEVSSPKHEKVFHLGNPDEDGCWKLYVDDEGLLCFERREGDTWILKQSLM